MSSLKAGDTLNITVKPGSTQSKIEMIDEQITVWVNAPAVDGKANKAVSKLFKKELGLKVVVLKGERSKYKVLRVEGKN